MIIVPIYSMRSYQTKLYSILRDGNFKLQICRAKPTDKIVVPSNNSDLQEALDLGILNIENIIQVEYFDNAYETRKYFWKKYQNYIDSFEEDIITDITGYNGRQIFINNFNITKNPDLPRIYIDEFIDIDIDSIDRSKYTTVLNQSQKDYLISLDKKIESKIIIDQKVISNRYFNSIKKTIPKTEKFDIFFPFRISDKCYEFDKTILSNHDKIFLITDPNDSYTGKYKNVIKQKLTKSEYYGLLSTKPTIIYNENPESVFHPGLADFIYFDCDIISKYKIPTLEEVLID